MGCARMPHFHKLKTKNKVQRIFVVVENISWLRGWQFLIPKSWRAYRSPSGDSKEARRRVWRVFGIGVGLLRFDGEVEGVVVKDDAVL